jgi:hypothetical protein
MGMTCVYWSISWWLMDEWATYELNLGERSEREGNVGGNGWKSWKVSVDEGFNQNHIFPTFCRKFEFQNLICVPLTHIHTALWQGEGKLCGTVKSHERKGGHNNTKITYNENLSTLFWSPPIPKTHISVTCSFHNWQQSNQRQLPQENRCLSNLPPLLLTHYSPFSMHNLWFRCNCITWIVFVRRFNMPRIVTYRSRRRYIYKST